MVKITKKEEAVLNLFWQNGPMFVKDLLEFYVNRGQVPFISRK